MMVEQKPTPCSENVKVRCKMGGQRAVSDIEEQWTPSLSAAVLAHPGERTESHPFMSGWMGLRAN